MCWVGREEAGSGRCLEVGLRVLVQDKGGLVHFHTLCPPIPQSWAWTLTPSPTRPGPHGRSLMLCYPGNALGSRVEGDGVAACRVRASVLIPALPTGAHACFAWKASHVILETEKGKGWLRVIAQYTPKPHVDSGLL